MPQYYILFQIHGEVMATHTIRVEVLSEEEISERIQAQALVQGQIGAYKGIYNRICRSHKIFFNYLLNIENTKFHKKFS